MCVFNKEALRNTKFKHWTTTVIVHVLLDQYKILPIVTTHKYPSLKPTLTVSSY